MFVTLLRTQSGIMLKSAVMNDIIAKHPMNGVRYTKPVRAVDDIKFKGIGAQDHLRRRKAVVPFHLQTRHILFSKAAMMKETSGKSLKRCHRF